MPGGHINTKRKGIGACKVAERCDKNNSKNNHCTTDKVLHDLQAVLLISRSSWFGSAKL
jgi:hypothetical protein